MSGTTEPALLALFAAVVESGGVRAAALRTGAPRSSVSRGLAALEAHLGARLLQRSTRALALTEEGDALYQRVRPALAALRDAEGVVRALRDRPTGTLRVAAPPNFAEFYLGPVLATYARRFPDVRVEVLLDDQVVDLVEGGIDCALRAGRLADSSLVARLLGSGRQRVFAAPEYLRTRGEPSHPGDLKHHEVLVFSGRKDATRWVFTAKGRKVSVRVTPRIQVNSLRLVHELACAGAGITLLPEFVAREHLRRGELREVLAAWSAPRGAISAVYPSEQHLAPRTRVFIDLLVEHFKAHPMGA
jgi:DNA-binding transcriptional LysR family regulator